MAEPGNDAPVVDQEESDGDDMSPIDSMREMIEYIARALASNPDAVSVSEEDDGDYAQYDGAEHKNTD